MTHKASPLTADSPPAASPTAPQATLRARSPAAQPATPATPGATSGPPPGATAHDYPVNLDVTGRAVIVVGGGRVAARKVAGLRRAGAAVTVVAPRAVAEIAQDANLTWIARPYAPGDVDGFWLAVTATDDPDVNTAVAVDGERARVWVNSADDPGNCTFTLPAVARGGGVQVAISTGGRSPALAGWLRARTESDLADGYAELLDLLGEARADARRRHGTSEVPGWVEALDGGLVDLVRTGRLDAARDRLWGHLGLCRSAQRDTAQNAEPTRIVRTDSAAQNTEPKRIVRTDSAAENAEPTCIVRTDSAVLNGSAARIEAS